MLLCTVESGAGIQIAAVAAPVALYFLVLGLLNTRRRPQLVRGRVDFLLLVAALAPLAICPLAAWVGSSPVALVAGAAAAMAATWLLSPPRGSWVIYNIAPADAVSVVERALRRAGLEFTREPGEQAFRLDRGQIRLSGFTLLRNVSIRAVGCDGRACDLFERALAEHVVRLTARTTPAAMAMLLVATAMLVAPLAMVAPKAVELVRILTGLLY
jgi:hypothetical protein